MSNALSLKFFSKTKKQARAVDSRCQSSQLDEAQLCISPIYWSIIGSVRGAAQ